MNLPPASITDVPRGERQKLEKLLFERACLGYIFSVQKLLEFLSLEDIQSCIVAWNSDEADAIKSKLNERITAIYTENGIEKTLRHTDPFGRIKDYIMVEGTSVRYDKNKQLEYAVSHGISAKKFTEALEAGRKETKYVSLQARDVKEDKNGDK